MKLAFTRFAWVALFLLAALAPGRSLMSQPASQPATAPADHAKVAERLLDEPTRRVVKLANGLTIILQENKTAPVVACRVYVRAGSLTEQQYMGCGISHVLEHLVAGASSKNRAESESAKELKILGGDSNAYTSLDHTCYFITTTAEKWPQAMQLLADWTTGAAFTQEQFDREYQVVQREIEMGEAEAARSFYKMLAANRYLVHPARIPVIGYKPAFQKLTRTDCQAYYNQMYVPGNMIVSIAGDIDLDKAEKTVTGLWAGVARTKVPVISLPDEPPVAAPRVAVARGNIRVTRVQWAFPTVTLYDPDMYALDVLAAILGDGESSILVRTLRDEKGLVTRISAGNNTPSYAPGELGITAELPVGQADYMPAQKALMAVLQQILAKGVEAKQVEKVKHQVAAALIFNNQTAEQQASHNASDYLATADINFTRLYAERIKAVTPEQVQAAAKKYIKPEVLLTTALLPQNAPSTTVSAATQVATTSQAAVEKITLDNGLRVLISKNTAAPLVTFQLYTMGALLAEDDTNNGIGTTMMELMARGTKTRSYDDITEFFDSTGGQFDTSMGNNAFIVSATALKENAAKTFDVVADVALNPAFSKDELDKLRPQLLAKIDRADEDWFGEGYKFLRESYFANSPYKRVAVGKADVVAKLTPEQIRKHYQTYFLDPEQTVLAIYGDVDPAQARQWAQRFAGIAKNKPKLNEESVPTAPRTVVQQSKKGSASVFIGYGPGMTITNEDRYPMTVLQTMLGGYNSPGGSILHETLRGKGLVYVVQASNIIGPAKGMFMIFALGEPKNADEIVKIIQQKVDEMKAGKFTDDDLVTAKDQAVTGEQLQNQTISSQAGEQAVDELMGIGYDARKKFAGKIRAVTRDDVVRVAKEYLTKPVIAISTPAAKAPTAQDP